MTPFVKTIKVVTLKYHRRCWQSFLREIGVTLHGKTQRKHTYIERIELKPWSEFEQEVRKPTNTEGWLIFERHYNKTKIGKILIEQPYPFGLLKVIDPNVEEFENKELLANNKKV